MTSNESTDDVINNQIPAVKREMDAGRLQVDAVDVFCETGVFDVEQSRKILQAGVEAGMEINFHGDELSAINSAEVKRIAHGHYFISKYFLSHLIFLIQIIYWYISIYSSQIFSLKSCNNLDCSFFLKMGAELNARAISHLEEISEEGIAAMARSKSAAVILPTTAYILR